MRPRQFFSAAVLLVIAPFCSAQSEPVGTAGSLLSSIPYVQQPGQQTDSAALHSISGQVVDGITGQPIYRALVQVGNQHAMLTDHEGHFEFPSVPSNESFVPWASKPGYSQSSRNGGLVQYTNGASQSEDKPLTLKLIPEALLYGAVEDENGQPLQGLSVQLREFRIMNGLGRWMPRQQTTTNAEGEFRFADLDAGKYSLSTGFHLDGLPDAKSSVAYVPVHYPAASASQPESAIILAPGERTEARLNPPVEKLYPVTGVVAGYGGSNGVAFEVETRDGEPLQPFTRFNPQTGEFRLMLPGGSYQLVANAYTQPGPLQARQNIVVPQGPVRGLTLDLEPFATIPVEIDSEIVATPDNPSQLPQPRFANISLSSSEATGFGSYYPAQPHGHHSGSEPSPLTIENVPPGHYLLQATPPSPWYVASADCGGVDLTQNTLAIAGGAAGCSVRVLLRNDSASLHCTLRNPGKPNQPVVYLLPIGDLTRPAQSLPFDANGEVTISGIAPGRYLVIALELREELPYRDPDSMRKYLPLGQEVTLTPNGKADVQLDIAHGEA